MRFISRSELGKCVFKFQFRLSYSPVSLVVCPFSSL
jgi:hypothetical protein